MKSPLFVQFGVLLYSWHQSPGQAVWTPGGLELGTNQLVGTTARDITRQSSLTPHTSVHSKQHHLSMWHASHLYIENIYKEWGRFWLFPHNVLDTVTINVLFTLNVMNLWFVFNSVMFIDISKTVSYDAVRAFLSKHTITLDPEVLFKCLSSSNVNQCQVRKS